MHDGDEDGSITRAMNMLGELDEQATQVLWSRFFERLCKFAESKIYPRHRSNISSDEIASTAFMSLVEGYRANRFQHLRNRDELWQVLTLIAARRAINERKRLDREKRGAGKVKGEQVLGRDGIEGIIDYVQQEKSPADYHELEDMVHALIYALPDQTLQAVVRSKLAGFSNAEIAKTLTCAERTVERKLKLIKQIWDERVNSSGHEAQF